MQMTHLIYGPKYIAFLKKKKNSDGSRSDKLGSSEQVPIQQVWLKW